MQGSAKLFKNLNNNIKGSTAAIPKDKAGSIKKVTGTGGTSKISGNTKLS